MCRIRLAKKNTTTIIIALALFAACAPLIDKTPKSVERTPYPALRPTTQNVLAPSLLAEWKTGKIKDMGWSPSGKLFAINYSVDNSDGNNYVRAFSAESFNSLWVAKNSLAWDLIFTSDGQFILESNITAPYFYWRSVEKGDIVRHIGYEDVILDPGDCGGGQIIMENISHNTALIASYSDLIGLNTQNMVVINQLDLATRKCKNLLIYQGSFDLFDLNSSGNLLAYGGEGKNDSIIIWDMEKQAEVCRIPQVEFGRFIPDENELAVVREQKIFFIEASTCRELRELNISPLVDYENYLAFSPDGKQFAVARDSIQIIDTVTGEVLAKMPFPQKAVPITSKLFLSGIKFSPDGHYLLVAYDLLELNSADDGEIQLWQLKP